MAGTNTATPFTFKTVTRRWVRPVWAGQWRIVTLKHVQRWVRPIFGWDAWNHSGRMVATIGDQWHVIGPQVKAR